MNFPVAYSDGLHDHAEMAEMSDETAPGAPRGGPRPPSRSRRRRGPVRSVVVSAAAAALAVAVAGCGSGTTPSTTTSTSTAGSPSSASTSTAGSPSSASASTAGSSGSASASASMAGSAGSASASMAGSAGSTSYPAGKEQVCQARDQLKTSTTALTNPSLLTGGSTAIKAAVDQVQTDLTAVAAAGKQDYQPQVTAMQSSLQQLQTAVGNLGNGSASENLKTIGTAIAATGTAAGDLFTQLKTACGS
jgi:hypothetical protein